MDASVKEGETGTSLETRPLLDARRIGRGPRLGNTIFVGDKVLVTRGTHHGFSGMVVATRRERDGLYLTIKSRGETVVVRRFNVSLTTRAWKNSSEMVELGIDAITPQLDQEA